MDKTAKPPRASLQKKHWLWLFLPLLLWSFCEVYDHVPKRSWFYRQTHTIALIDVTAKLEIDGQPLTLTRTLRCIRQPPVRGLARNWAAPDSMTVFDAVGGVTSTGRTFILNVPKACEAIFFNDKNEAFATMLNNEHLAGAPRAHGPLEPVSYSGGDLVAPVIYEPVGGNPPDKIIAYLAAPELFTTGNQGVKFVDLTIQKSAQTTMLFDKTEFDMLRSPGKWYANSSDSPYYYESRIIVEQPQAYWRLSPQLTNVFESCHRPCVLNVNYSGMEPKDAIVHNFGYFSIGSIAKPAADNFEYEEYKYTFTATTYPTDYKDHAFHILTNMGNTEVYIRLPEDSYRFIKDIPAFVVNYDFEGVVQEITDRNNTYVFSDGRVIFLGQPYRLNIWR